MSFFQKLNKVSVATVNFEKTKILPINADQITLLQERLPHTAIKEQYEAIKILGISFCQGLKQAAFINWQLTPTKLQNHINKLSSRELSLMGKAIILNTLILAKTAYLSNTLPIPQDILTQIHKQIFHYIWPKNQEPIAKKALFLLKNKGGVNIKELEVHNLAMRIKHLLNLKHKKKLPAWTYLATYWLPKDIYKFGKEYN